MQRFRASVGEQREADCRFRLAVIGGAERELQAHPAVGMRPVLHAIGEEDFIRNQMFLAAASLQNTQLNFATFEESDLGGASFSNADLSGATF